MGKICPLYVSQKSFLTAQPSISPSDREHIRRAVPQDNNKIIAASVARLYVAHPFPNKWRYTGLCGAAVFAFDKTSNTSFLKLVDLMSGRGVLWDQELYEGCEYNQDRTFFHSLEIEKCQVGLSFSEESEASSFYNKVQKNLSTFKGSKKNQTSQLSKKSKGDIDRSSISGPVDFRRVSHIGFDADKGFTIDSSDPQWSSLLAQLDELGISRDQIEQNADFIKEFVAQNGGAEALAPPYEPEPEQLPAQTSPRLRPVPPPVPRNSRRGPPPPVPSRGSRRYSLSNEIPAQDSLNPPRNISPLPPLNTPRNASPIPPPPSFQGPARPPKVPLQSQNGAAPPPPRFPVPPPFERTSSLASSASQRRNQVPPPVPLRQRGAPIPPKSSSPSIPHRIPVNGSTTFPVPPSFAEQPSASPPRRIISSSAEGHVYQQAVPLRSVPLPPSVPSGTSIPNNGPPIPHPPLPPMSNVAIAAPPPPPPPPVSNVTAAPPPPPPPPSMSNVTAAPPPPPPPPPMSNVTTTAAPPPPPPLLNSASTISSIPLAPPAPHLPNRDHDSSFSPPKIDVSMPPGRADLLASIRSAGGIGALKKAKTNPERPVRTVSGNTAAGGGNQDLSNALAMALSARKGKVAHSDDEDEKDDDWD
ncbi:Wiskott-Aldrich syndrome 1 [Neolecta irregularis DAH-3]|uniref:Wiskott-Aldrich syndrome 1 n=1 Tax=Neolecta irregularis (strain DAH-3) TaxID=1198029 RepID=A0A1U7LJZ1_NEOID|nr:Wiskott-Aldrich syndrome 1 [Neolecta irregularis DAH-3]|eukprot:OLL22959.1 Wiskott-Aldrich syndrome 1 [Neolecta irregularis DAH-3]